MLALESWKELLRTNNAAKIMAAASEVTIPMFLDGLGQKINEGQVPIVDQMMKDAKSKELSRGVGAMLASKGQHLEMIFYLSLNNRVRAEYYVQPGAVIQQLYEAKIGSFQTIRDRSLSLVLFWLVVLDVVSDDAKLDEFARLDEADVQRASLRLLRAGATKSDLQQILRSPRVVDLLNAEISDDMSLEQIKKAVRSAVSAEIL